MNIFDAVKEHKHSDANKSVKPSQRILSVRRNDNFLRERRITAWSVRAVIFWGKAIVKAKQQKTFVITLSRGEQRHRHHHTSGSITLVREHFLKLRNFPKPTRDQLIILLSMDMGFRSGEVASARIENVDLDNGNMMVQDSKKYKLYPVPLTYEVARLIQELLAVDNRSEGWLILQHDRVAWRRGKPITTVGLCWTWKKWARRADIPNWQVYNPTLGRHYFACWWHYIKKGNLEVLRRILRHTSFLATQFYLSRLIFYEDVKAEMRRLQTIPTIETNQEECDRSEICKFYERAADGGCKFESICKHYKEVHAT